MLKRFIRPIFLGVFLIFLSALLYFIHYLIFKDAHHIFIYLLGDIAFIPIEVLIVTVIIHRLLSRHEKRSILNKLNMVVGAFFSEAGTDLLKIFSRIDPNIDTLRQRFMVTSGWAKKDFSQAGKLVKDYKYTIEIKKVTLLELKEFLVKRREFMLALLENPNLLEHEKFTNLLWAVFHLTEELANRERLDNLPSSDYEHLAKDITRVYSLLAGEWLKYMEHLNSDYPYLFSLAMRTNPFDLTASVIVK
jgi:vacuolar-type H+-ATPase subunit I/STV1